LAATQKDARVFWCDFVAPKHLNHQNRITDMNNTDSRWKWLYKIGAAAALLFVVFLPIQILVFFVSPPPDSILGWFALFQNSRLVGLLDLDLLLMVDQVLTMLIFLALYVALRETSESFMAVGLVLGLASTVLFIASNPAFAMLSLSDQYAAATTDAQRAALLAAGQATMTMWQGSAFQASYFLGSIAPIIFSAVMLRTSLFSKATAYFGILANVIALGLYVPVIGTYISIFSVVFLWVWCILLGLRFFSLGRPVAGHLQPAEAV
jgi:hypothetical protein